MTSTAGRLIGQSVPRVEDPAILTGQGRYVDDIQLPRMLHGVFLRSTVPHGRVVKLDVEQATSMPGVIAVLTGSDLAPRTHTMQSAIPVPGLARPRYGPMTMDRVRYIGDPVAFIVAESRNLAEDARDLIDMDVEQLPPIAGAADALDATLPPLFDDMTSNVLFKDKRTMGDPAAAFEAADHIVRERFRTQRVAPCPMECRGGVADYVPGDDTLTYYAGTQAPHAVKAALVNALDHPAERLTVITPNVGGAFGQKAMFAREDVTVAAAAKRLGQPVKWIEDRIENLVSATHARDEELEVAAAVSSDGRVLALDVKVVLDQGAYSLTLPPTTFTAQMRAILPGPYKIDNIGWEETIVVSNKASYGFYRGPWAAETLVREVLLDRIAQTVGRDRAEVRRVNLVSLEEQPRVTGAGTTVEGVQAVKAFERALKSAGYAELSDRRAEAGKRGKLLGLGIATYLEPAPGPSSYWTAIGMPMPGERAVARLELNGHVTISTSQAPHGQGHETTLAQVAATELGVSMASVRVVYGNTETTPFSVMGTAASRAATMATGAVLHSTRAMKAKILAMAGEMLEINVEDLYIAEDAVSPKGSPDIRIPLGDLAQAAWFAPPAGMEPGLRTEWHFEEPKGGWSGGTHVCIMEVDPLTAETAIIRYLVVEDCGQLINPAIVDGQIRGGVAQGIGQALYEQAPYDTDGSFLASTFLDYLLPTAMEIPTIEIEHLDSEPLHEVDYRGVGEGGMIAAPAAVLNAISDALHGAPLSELPILPSKLADLIDKLDTNVGSL